MQTQTTTTDTQHAVFVTKANGERFRLTDATSWDWAVAQWTKLDDDRRAGLYPHVKHFEVRSMDDPSYRDLRVLVLGLAKVEKSRGMSRERAARKAWLAWQAPAPGRVAPEQGRGGWFYYRNGCPAAQGLYNLATLAQRRGLVVQGQDGKWYVVERETL